MTNGNDIAWPEIITELENNGLQNTYSYGGLTKREYFAAMALQGLLASGYLNDYDTDRVVADAVLMADKTITELNKNQ